MSKEIILHFVKSNPGRSLSFLVSEFKPMAEPGETRQFIKSLIQSGDLVWCDGKFYEKNGIPSTPQKVHGSTYKSLLKLVEKMVDELTHSFDLSMAQELFYGREQMQLSSPIMERLLWDLCKSGKLEYHKLLGYYRNARHAENGTMELLLPKAEAPETKSVSDQGKYDLLAGIAKDPILGYIPINAVLFVCDSNNWDKESTLNKLREVFV